MRIKSGYLLFFILLLNPLGTSYTQIIPFENYTVKNGLPSNCINDIEQDHKGYIWLATQVGAVKFDGYNFLTYTIENGLPDNNIVDICIDNKNRIWFATESGGIAYLEYNTIHSITSADGLVSNNTTEIFIDKSENIWCVTYDGISIFKPDNIINFNSANSPIDNEVLSTYIAMDGTVWLTTINGVFYYKDSFQEFRNKNLEGLNVYDITEDYPNSYWFATEGNGVVHIDPTGKVSIFNKSSGLKTNLAMSLEVIDKNQVLAGTYRGGLYLLSDKGIEKKWINNVEDKIIMDIVYDFKRNSIWAQTLDKGIILIKDNLIQNLTVKNNLIDDHAKKIFIDNSGNKWIGTINGISKYGKTIFEIYNNGFIADDKSVISIAYAKGKTYIGTYNGLNILCSDGTLKNFPVQVRSDQEKGVFALETFKNDIWLGTFLGLTKYSRNQFSFYPSDLFISESNFSIAANDIEIDKNNEIVLATSIGLMRYDQKKYRLIKNENFPGSNFIWNIAIDHEGNTWCATTEGLSIYDGKEFHTYFEKDGIANNVCHDIAFDNENNGWLATDKGISKIWLNKDFSISCTNIGKENGLVSDNIYLIAVDKNNLIWAGHNKGLERINPKKLNIRHYGPVEGFLPVETSIGAVSVTDDNELWFGTVEGAVKYLPKNDINFTDPPKVYITGIELYNDTTSVNSFAKGIDSITFLPKDLKLRYNKNNLVFKYVGLHYTIVEKNQYRYFLEGYDNEWSSSTYQNQSPPYRKLTAGVYNFKVMASNCDGVWSEGVAAFSFEILPPFWKTWWFYSLEAITLLLLFVSFIRLRERKLRTDKQLLAQKVKERTIEVEQQRDKIAEQKKEITDSIVYAQRIQNAILPKGEFISSLLNEYFILLKPRDIVSGDFYWISGNKKKIVLVAADCTGHGVPGAFMSMLGVSILNEIASPEKIQKSNLILDTLRKHLTSTLWQTGRQEDTKDGMDMVLCIIDFEKMNLDYAGAYNPLVHIRNKEINIIKGDKMPVGYHEGAMGPFTSTEIQLLKGDCLYIFSDGYADQFGGSEDKKFKSSQLYDLLQTISHEKMDVQKAILTDTFEHWKGDNEQVDDILVIGIRI
jgi:ligand-binding sensor domain-containing protein/serine phosphatase RsbU (regulator of sigma subunit)